MNKKIGWSVIVIVVIVLVIFGMGNRPTNNKPVIKIGVIAPMTGGSATYGVGLVKGIQMAESDLKDTNYDYEVLVEDDASNIAQSASAAQKLINIDKVQAIISTTGGTGNAIKSFAANSHIPHISVSSNSSIADGQYNFLNSVMPDEEALAWLHEAKLRGVKTIAILAQNQAGFNLMMGSINKFATSTGISIVYEEHFEPTVKDFNTDIAKARLTKPDLYLIGAYPPPLDIIGQELKNLGIGNVAGIATFPTSAAPEIFNGLWYTDASLADVSFKDRFNAKFPDTRFNVRVVPYGYDSFNLLVNGFESGSVVDYLHGLTEYQGKAGTLTKSKGDVVFHSPVGIWTIKDGQSIQLK